MSAKYKFVVFAPDNTDPGASQRRADASTAHVEGAKKNLQLKVGGAMFTPESLESEAQMNMVGSVVFFEAESLEEVKKIIENDPFYTENVWDKEKLVISPFFQVDFDALRKE